MPSPLCSVCGTEPARPYTITKGATNRDMALCDEHGAPLEDLLRLTATKVRRQVTELVAIEDLRPSRAILARARAAQAPVKAPRKAKGPRLDG